MGYTLQFNCLLTVSSQLLDLGTLEVGKTYTIAKNLERLYPLNIPIEICNENHQYYGKVAVRKLTLERDKTTMTFEVLKLFTTSEAAVYTDNFIKPS
jgi:hypothetical protein